MRESSKIEATMAISKLSEASIRRHTTAKILERGESYYHSGAVSALIQRGNTLQAQVQGNEVHPYRVICSFDDSGIKQANCTCPYDFGGWCKHIVAVLLLSLRQPESIEQRPSLERLLDRLDLVQTQCLVQDLVAKQPELIDLDEVAIALNEAWAEAILSAELTPPEQVDLRVNLEVWQEEWNASFQMSLEALEQGWNYPPLQRILQGEIPKKGASEPSAPDDADNLTLIRLQILERQERYQEYLYLAAAQGQTEHYLTMLASLGRIEEAMQVAKTQMSSMNTAFALAQSLQKREALAQALEIAQMGLTLPGNCEYELAIWTSNLAEGLGNTEGALAARVQAFKAKPEFGDYRLAQHLAEERWEEVKTDLLASLRQQTGWGTHEAKVDIFLNESLIDDAIAIVSNLSDYQEELIRRVMKKAIKTHPNWVIENAIRRAESIMDRGKAEAYAHAVSWLKLAHAAYKEAGWQSAWLEYRAKLMQIHARKYKLMAMLKAKDLD
jgi:uncharacterized Zn finger protein